MMPKENDVDQIINGLEHLLREGVDEGEKTGNTVEPLSEEQDHLIDEDTASGAVEDSAKGKSLWTADPSAEADAGKAQPRPAQTEAANEKPGISTSHKAGPLRLVLTEEMLLDEQQPGIESPAAATKGENRQEEMLEYDGSDQTEQEDEGDVPGGNGLHALHPLRDKEKRARFVKMISADVSARLAGELPRLVEACLNRRLAEFGSGLNESETDSH